MKHKKYIAIALTALLTFGSAQTALAAVIYYDLSTEGDLKISSPGDKYVVTSSGKNPTDCTIIVEEGVKDGVVTHIVLNGVNIETTNENGIKIGSNANVVLELDGTNSITVNTESYDTAKAGINVANGKLTIKGDGSLDVKVIDNGYLSDDADGAAIGSDDGEKFNGTIIIEGGNITAVSEYGAGIGSGYDGEMSGTITISDGEVTASSDDGAGIGSGWYGEMSGTITISGGEVTASSDDDGAGIGSGWDGEMSGTITISDGEVTASSGYYGAGIGSSWEGEMSGFITISGGEVTASSNTGGAGIGSGYEADMNGTITITDDAKVDITLGDTSNKTGIGAGKYSSKNPYYKFNGGINILEHANVNMIYSDPYDPYYEGVPNIGSINPDSTGGITLSTGATINGVSGEDTDALKEMGILNDNAEVTTVEPTQDSIDTRNTYSLKPLNLVQRINKAESGEVVAVSEKQLSKGKLPAYALEALAKKENVTLAILCEKFDILIPSEDAVADAGSTQFYTIDELVKMYE